MMKEKIIILTPVYNDWKNLAKLLSKTNKIFKKQLKTKFELVIVNDCSEEKYNFQKYKLSMVKKITILSLFKNVGSQRAIAIGIKYLSIYYKKKFKTIIMDSDGQDNPKIISKMLSASNTNSKFSIVIDRNQRKDPIWFKIFSGTLFTIFANPLFQPLNVNGIGFNMIIALMLVFFSIALRAR